MTKLQAAMRDKAAKGWRERKLYYRVGSCFKGCMNCGETEERGRRKIFVTGLNVFRSYSPKWVGWTYLCADCGAKDLRCWANAGDIGQEPRILPGYEKEEWKIAQRKLKQETDAERPQPRMTERELQIMRLEARLEELRQMMTSQGGK